MIRVDKGTGTVEMVTMHAYLRQNHQDMDPNETVIYGPSTANQVQYILGCIQVTEYFWHEFAKLQYYLQLILAYLRCGVCMDCTLEYILQTDIAQQFEDSAFTMFNTWLPHRTQLKLFQLLNRNFACPGTLLFIFMNFYNTTQNKLHLFAGCV